MVMKKIGKYLLLVLFYFCFMFQLTDVKAASIPYRWSSNGLEINEENNINNTATVKKEENEITLTLNNYNGGALVEECYGTEVSDVTFNIELIGTNTITANNGTGIEGTSFLNNNVKINFIGNGNLTINATKPINYENYSDYLYVSPSENIYTNVKQENIEKDTDDMVNKETKEEQTKNTKVDSSDSNKTDKLVNILLGVLSGVILFSGILFIVLFKKINRLKNNNTI